MCYTVLAFPPRLLALLVALTAPAAVPAADIGFVPLFPETGVQWTVKDGILTSQSSQQRGTWLVSEKEYGDFVLEFDVRLGERGNSGVALRAPMRGDPAFD